MEAYTAFAKIYDKFMENVPYEKWGDFLEFVINKYGISRPVRNSTDVLESERNLVLDMGCGTGILTEIMYNRGYDMIGLDLSQEMLDVALRRKLALSGKADDNSEGILYICQDMCQIDLFSTIGTVYSSCDSINYLLEDAEIENCFSGVSNYLYPGGLFIFDVNTIHKYRDLIGDITIADNAEEGSFIWDNYYDDEARINEYDLTLFIRDEDADSNRNLYEKFTETHYQRAYEVDEILDFLEGAGLKPIAVIDEAIVNEDKYKDILLEKISPEQYVNIGLTDESERVIFIAMKPE